jgi:hypothetical protein
MIKIENLFKLAAVAMLVIPSLVACASEEEDDTTSTSLASGCPSPVEDREAFTACVKAKTGASGGSSGTGAAGKNNQSSKNGNAGNGGNESTSENGGSIKIGDIDATGCSNLTISCVNETCTCSANGGPEKSCDGNNCVAICCAK